MADLPRITVLTPNFNDAAFLETALKSVLDQGYPDLEYIIMDGGSTDCSLDLIDRYRDRVTLVLSEPDEGHGDALNKGFSLATGDIMGWLNSDDALLPGSLSLLAHVFSVCPEVEWVTSQQATVGEMGGLIRAFVPRPWSRLRGMVHFESAAMAAELLDLFEIDVRPLRGQGVGLLGSQR